MIKKIRAKILNYLINFSQNKDFKNIEFYH